MTAFVIVSLLLTGIVLGFLLVPLLSKRKKVGAGDTAKLSIAVLNDQLADLERERDAGRLTPEQYTVERDELERRALEDGTATAASGESVMPVSGIDKRMVVIGAVVVGVLGVAVGLYFWLGSPEAMTGAAKDGADPHGNSHALTPQQIEQMVGKLAERLQENPNDAEGWLMLAKSYAAMKRFPESAAAYGRASALMPRNAQLLADYADSLAMAQGRRLEGEPLKLIDRALEIDPKHIKSLALSGSAAFEQQDYHRAVAQWKKILEVVPPESPAANSIRNSIADAESRLGISPQAATGSATAPNMTTSGKTAAAVARSSVSGTAVLSDSVRRKVGPDDTVFLFARPVEGRGIPVAMAKKSVRDFPLQFTLDDSMSMIPSAKLSGQKLVIVGVRVSRTGDASSKPGDFEGLSAPVAPGATGIKIVVDKTVQ